MGAGNVFPAEMPDDPDPMVPLDEDTAERLLAGRLHPDDAPPGYAEVARLLRTAAGPPSPDELAGQEAALELFRTTRPGSGRGRGRRRRARARGRLVALALAGTLVAGGVLMGGGALAGGGVLPRGGVWTADGVLTALGLRSEPSRPAAGPGAGGRPPALHSAGDRTADRHGRGVASRGGGPGTVGGPEGHGKPLKPKPPKPKPPKAGKDEPAKGKADKPKPPRGKADTAEPAKGEPATSHPAEPGPPEAVHREAGVTSGSARH